MQTCPVFRGLDQGLAVGANYFVMGIGPHTLEIGAGLSCIFQDDNDPIAFIHSLLGYRFQPQQSSFFFRICFSLLIFKQVGFHQDGGRTLIGLGQGGILDADDYIYTSPLMPWAGISVGWTF
jgi:hypothetical protein